MERGKIIDLLGDRTAEAVVQWFKEHPEIEIVSRDRSQTDTNAITQGASEAVQVADRWHLLHNLGEALSADYECYAHLTREITVKPAKNETPETSQPDSTSSPHPSGQKKRTSNPIQQAREIRRAYWQAKLDEVHRLPAQGTSIRAIARETGLQRQTVRKYIRLPELPHKTSPKSGPRLRDPYRENVREILKNRPISSRKLWEELCSQGFRGSHSTVYLTMVEIRQELGVPSPRSVSPAESQPAPKPLTAHQLTWRVLKHSEKCSEEEQQIIQKACQLDPHIQQATLLVKDFADMLRNRQAERFEPWLQRVQSRDLPALKGFVTGVRKDYAAVQAALSMPWSNGPTEGHINRLKCLKRQMYGRAKDDLLRKRALWQGRWAFT